MTLNNTNNIKEKIIETIEERKDEIIDLTRELVKTPSENSPPNGDELACQEIIYRFFKEAAIKTDFIYLNDVPGIKKHEAYLAGRNYKNRPNVIAILKGFNQGRSLLLSGHIDTMPVGKGKWNHPPFSADIENGKLYGRGAYDMKAGLSSMLMALRILKEMGIKLKGDLLFESVVDEEHAGCNGTLANRLIKHNADAVILSEPSNLDIYIAHRGFRVVHLIIKGNSGMSFAGEKLENPIEHIGRLIEGMKIFREKRRKETNIPAIYREEKDPVPVFMTKLQAGEFNFRIPMAIPEICKLEVYWQTMPGEKQEDIEKEFFGFLDRWCRKDKFFSKNPPDWKFSLRWMPGSEININHPIAKTLKKVASEITNQTINIKGAPYPCDLFIFNLYGNIPGIILGPRGGNAHGVDEFVFVEDLISLTKIFACIAIEWCGIK